VLEVLGLAAESCEPHRILPALAPQEREVLEAMGYAPIDMDSISELVAAPIEAVSASLLKLELDGHISRLPGGLFQRLP
jgi:DNA processing protein